MAARPTMTIADRQYPQNITKLIFATGTERFRLRFKPAGIDQRFESRDGAVAALHAAQGVKATTARKAAGEGNKTVNEACDLWEAKLDRRVTVTKSLALGTFRNYQNSLKYLRKVHGNMNVRDLEARHIEHVIEMGIATGIQRDNQGGGAQKARAWQTGTVELFRKVTQMMLEFALVEGLVTNNAAAKLEVHKQEERTQFQASPLTEQELVAAKAAASKSRLGYAWLLGLAGFRRGEIAGLRWADVDFERKAITIANTRTDIDGQVHEKGPKSGRIRTYPLTPELDAALRSAKAKQAEERIALGPDYFVSGYVAVDEGGDPYNPRVLTDRWTAFLKANGIAARRLHDARHTFGTMGAHTPGVDMLEVSRLMGHARPSFTMDVYGSSLPARLVTTAEALGRLGNA